MADTLNAPPPSRVGAPTGSYVEWSAIIAGGVLAAAISFVLLTFGTAIGLSATSPWHNSVIPTKVIASIAILWVMAQQIGAVIAGAYVAGRMRSRWAEANAHEIEFRDGLHGGLVWAVCLLLTTMLAFAAAGSIARTAADLNGRTASNPSIVDPVASQTDQLLRPAPAQRAARETAGSVAEVRNEIIATFARAIASGSLADNDRTYIAGVVAQRSGIPPEEADRRVLAAYAEASRAVKQAADNARRAGVLTGFVTAFALLVSLAAGWWAGIKGGNHRDNAVPARFVLRRPTS